MGQRAKEPGLFDLPLTAPSDDAGADGGDPPEPEPEPEAAPERPRPPARGRRTGAAEEELPLFTGSPSSEAPDRSPPARRRAAPSSAPRPSGTGPQPVAEPPAADLEPPLDRSPTALHRPARGPRPAPFAARLLAAAADLGVHAAVTAVAWAGTALTGARLDAADLPALGIFLVAFSFLYSVVSLAFWGRTPGMAAAHVVARGPSDQPLTFGQTGLRWLAALLTVLLAGLPLLVALTGRSLPDRLSGSQTHHSR